MNPLIDAWTDFVEMLGIFPVAGSALNPPCPEGAIRAVERRLDFSLPPSLVTLLKQNNGQKLDQPGLFKSVSGWDRYRRSAFLDVEGIATAYERFLQDEVLVAEFGTDEIPFAVVGRPDRYEEIFSIHRQTQAASLIFTEYIDPRTPADWQVYRRPRGTDLAEFLARQKALYL